MTREYRPRWAPHVVGRYSEVEGDPDTRQVAEGQRYEIVCEACGERWGPTTCTSGLVRQRIARFAAQHQHQGHWGPQVPRKT